MQTRPGSRKQTPASEQDADLEFDVLSALEEMPDDSTANDGGMRDLGRELGLDSPAESSDYAHGPITVRRAPQQSSHEEFELPGADEAEMDIGLELESAPQARQPPSAQAAASTRARTGPTGNTIKTQPVTTQQVTSRTRPLPLQSSQAAPPLSAAALRTQVEVSEEPTRNLPLLQLLLACAVFALGHWLNSSVIYGNAGPTSVIAHGLALQQLFLGIRGLLR